MSVQTHLSNLASELVLTLNERASIATSIATLSTRLNDHFTVKIKEQIQFGSSTRGTILPRKADDHSDIDYMIIFDNSDTPKPQSFITRLKTFAETRYGSSHIKQSHPTLVLSLNHIKFELVPAYRNWLNTIHIPGPASGFTDWITTDPNDFNRNLTTKNQNNSDLIKPMIRLMKYWNAKNGYVYESYGLEKALVADSYLWCYSLKDYFFKAFDNRSSWELNSQWRKDRFQRAKDIIYRIKDLEAKGSYALAEQEISKLLPPIY
ncbi:MAG: SMODS domain-containing nucleotidyltransferase [Flavobacteriales bacterium]